MKKLDAHTHIYPSLIAEKACENLGNFYNFEVKCSGTDDDLVSQLVDNEFCGMFILGVATNAKQVKHVNNNLIRAKRKADEKGLEAYTFAGMHQDFEDMPAEVERCHELGFTGFKIHPDIQGADIDDKRFYPLYEAIEGRMPLVLHMGDDRPEYRFSEPGKLFKIAKEFPKLKICASHLGGYKAWEEAKCLHGLPNIWYDLSSSLWAIPPEEAEKIISECGYDRVMYGSDYPVCTVEEYLGYFSKLTLPDNVYEDIFYNNAMRFISLD